MLAVYISLFQFQVDIMFKMILRLLSEQIFSMICYLPARETGT